MIELTWRGKKNAKAYQVRFEKRYKKKCGKCTTRKLTTEELAKLDKRKN
jgi:hypothetical protein